MRGRLPGWPGGVHLVAPGAALIGLTQKLPGRTCTPSSPGHLGREQHRVPGRTAGTRPIAWQARRYSPSSTRCRWTTAAAGRRSECLMTGGSLRPGREAASGSPPTRSCTPSQGLPGPLVPRGGLQDHPPRPHRDSRPAAPVPRANLCDRVHDHGQARAMSPTHPKYSVSGD